MSSALLEVGSLRASPGQKVQGYLAVPGGNDAIPVTLVNGARPGNTVVILSGIHGGEYAGIETAIRLAAELRPEELSGAVILAHPVNTPAFYARRQYIYPPDGKNLNRMFPGRTDGSPSEQVAAAISEHLFRQADFVMDLHGGDIHEGLAPFVIHSTSGTPDLKALAENAARHLGFPYLIGADYPGTTFGTAGEMGIPGFLAELGQCGRWSEGEVASYINGVRNVLRYLQVLPGAPVAPDREPVRLSQFRTTSAAESGCWYPFVAVGDRVTAGSLVGEMRDFFGHPLRTYQAGQDGVVLVLIQSLAVPLGDPLFAIGGAGPAAGAGK